MRELYLKKGDRPILSRNKKQLVIGVVLLFLCITSYLCIQKYKKMNMHTYINQAREYARIGLYEKAVSYYEKSLSYHPVDEVSLVLELSDVYYTLKDYDNAVACLKDYYKQTDDIRLKNKFNQTVDLIANTQYAEYMERANLYWESGDYHKALQEYKEAYRVCSNEKEVVIAIISTFIQLNQMEEAKQFYQNIMNDFEIDAREQMKKIIEDAELEVRYEQILEGAEEAFYNGDYESCYRDYRNAILLMPSKETAYKQMVDVYISQHQYERAQNVIREYIQLYSNYGLTEIEQYIDQRKTEEESINSIMQQLYVCLSNGEMDKVLEVVHAPEYTEWIKQGTSYYYDEKGGYQSSKLPVKSGMVIHTNGCIYCGDFSNGKRSGKGRYFGVEENELGYFLYNGDWVDDLPTGEGTLYTMMQVANNHELRDYKVTIQGGYKEGYESGEMQRDFYYDNQYYGTLKYYSIKGVPQAVDVLNFNHPQAQYSTYTIGEFVTVEGTRDFQYTYSFYGWKIPGF